MSYGSRIRQAREIAMITQKELSREAQVAQSHLSRAERDEYELSPDSLGLLAAHLDFPEAFFASRPLVEFGTRPVHFRAQAGMSMKQADQAVRMGELVVEAFVRLEERVEGPELQLPPGPFATPEDAAVAAREAFGLAFDEPASALPLLLERFGITVVGLPLVASRRDAFSLWTDERPVVALLDNDAGDRQLWSAAHELGHLLLHRRVPTSRDVEHQADEFAGHFLLPHSALDVEMPFRPTLSDFAMLKRRWGVSIAALIRLARRLDRISQEQYTSMFRQMSARGERLRERTFIPAIKPRGLRAMAEIAYGLSPAVEIAEANSWSVLFAEKVLDRFARASELPLRRSALGLGARDVVDLASVRRVKRNAHEKGKPPQ